MSTQYLAILIHHGREIAMQIDSTDNIKKARADADSTVDPFSGKWVHVVEVNDRVPVNLLNSIKDQ